MREFSIQEKEYRISPITCELQGYLMIKIAPILATFSADEFQSVDSSDATKRVVAELASLSPKDYLFIMFWLLKGIQRKDSSGSWSSIVRGDEPPVKFGQGWLMFDDMDVVDMGRLAFEGIKENFAKVFTDPRLTSIRGA